MIVLEDTNTFPTLKWNFLQLSLERAERTLCYFAILKALAVVQYKQTFELGKIRMELKIDTDLKYTITNGISKVPIDPTYNKNFLQGQR